MAGHDRVRGAVGSGWGSELLGSGAGASHSGERTPARRESSGDTIAGAGDDSATAGEPQSLRRLEDVPPSGNDSTLAVWADPEDRKELELSIIHEVCYHQHWRYREEARIQENCIMAWREITAAPPEDVKL